VQKEKARWQSTDKMGLWRRYSGH